jgi:hypothetical protein
MSFYMCLRGCCLESDLSYQNSTSLLDASHGTMDVTK